MSKKIIKLEKTKIKKKHLKPFLRWAGGKNWFTKHINSFLPEEFNDYHEPFLGGASIFFYLKSSGLIKNNAFLSDSNKDLINCYEILKNNPESLIQILKYHKNEEKEYYRIRETVYESPIERAAQFIYLNRTSFNGVYRVNRKGKYNVPFGRRKLTKLYDFEHLLHASKLLQDTFFNISDFKDKCDLIRKGDFVFIDPPYTVAHANNGFVQYNQSIFSWENQMELANITKSLDKNEIQFLVTNAFHPSILDLYQTGKQIPISRQSLIGGKGATRAKYKEILITNINT